MTINLKNAPEGSVLKERSHKLKRVCKLIGIAEWLNDPTHTPASNVRRKNLQASTPPVLPDHLHLHFAGLFADAGWRKGRGNKSSVVHERKRDMKRRTRASYNRQTVEPITGQVEMMPEFLAQSL